MEMWVRSVIAVARDKGKEDTAFEYRYHTYHTCHTYHTPKAVTYRAPTVM